MSLTSAFSHYSSKIPGAQTAGEVSVSYLDIQIGAGNQISRRVSLNFVFLPFSQMRTKDRESWGLGVIVELKKGEALDNT